MKYTKYVVENWDTEEIIKIFDCEEQREKWIKQNTVSFYDGVFIKNTEIRISFYETR